MDKPLTTKIGFQHRLGFTLMELLIVIAILALLMTILLLSLNYQVQFQKARDTKRKSDLNLIKAKIEDFYNNSDSYPAPPCPDPCCEIDCDSNFLSPSLEKFPCDPQKKKYTYCAEAVKSQTYKIYTQLEYTQDTAIASSGCKDGCSVSGNCYNYGVGSTNTSLTTSTTCNALTPTQAVEPTQVSEPTLVPGGSYFACQNGICNSVGYPETQCGAGKQFPVCYLNDAGCGTGCD